MGKQNGNGRSKNDQVDIIDNLILTQQILKLISLAINIKRGYFGVRFCSEPYDVLFSMHIRNIGRLEHL